ncbi:zinc finger and SCAN domain-containing protein 31-like [Elgaria multicarinata webbii]|uniref:zinc finger and SCAN domain-containing protein 31-like n=1 Tax=Elgaria multicarinata webbii TaxID=159646 RepID=UPI002FCD6967
MKMEERGPAGCIQGERSQAVRKGPPLLQAVVIGEDPQRIPVAQIKQEPGERELQQWETQWQEFLKTVEAPQSVWAIPPLPEEPTPWDDAKAFLASFEQVAEACRWPKEEWVARLLPALSGEAKQAFRGLEAEGREDYGKVKAAILRGDALSREKNRQHFRCFCYQEAEGPREAYSQLQELCHRWLKVERHSKEQILETLILEQFLTILPPEIQRWVREWGPGTCPEAVALAEDFLLRQRAASRWEQQVQAASSVKTEPTPFVPGQKQLQKQAKAKQDLNARLLGYMQVPEGGENIPEYSKPSESVRNHTACSELVKPDRAPQKRALGNVSLVEEDGKTSGEQRSPKRQPRNHPRNGTSDCTPGVANEILDECFVRHKRQAHVITEESFGEVSGLSGQERVLHHEAPFQRGECDKTVGHKDQLLRHQRILPLENPRKCSYCGKAACQTFHKEAHTEKKLFQCSACGKCFSRNSLLIKHERTHGGEKPYTCSTCGKSFVYSWNLIKHKKKHTGEKPHQCSACGKTFFERSDLIRHERTHTGEKPYRCAHCWRRFSQKWLLIKHERTHAG